MNAGILRSWVYDCSSCTCVQTFTHFFDYVCMHTYAWYTRVCVCLYVYIYKYIHTYVHMCVLRISHTWTRSSHHGSMCVFMCVLFSYNKTTHTRIYRTHSTTVHKYMNMYINKFMCIYVLQLFLFFSCMFSPLYITNYRLAFICVCMCIGYIDVSHLHGS
jgi:hypothetical protein